MLRIFLYQLTIAAPLWIYLTHMTPKFTGAILIESYKSGVAPLVPDKKARLVLNDLAFSGTSIAT